MVVLIHSWQSKAVRMVKLHRLLITVKNSSDMYVDILKPYLNSMCYFYIIQFCITDTFGHPNCLVIDSCGYFYLP